MLTCRDLCAIFSFISPFKICEETGIENKKKTKKRVEGFPIYLNKRLLFIEIDLKNSLSIECRTSVSGFLKWLDVMPLP